MDVSPALQTEKQPILEPLRARTAPGTIALTFDDGPDPVWTPRMLELLGDSPATFFLDTSRLRAHPHLAGAIIEAGHEVGFHCDRHLRHSELSGTEIAQDLDDGLSTLADLRLHPRAWRPPWGVATDATRHLAAEHGLELWGWSTDTHDWRGDSAGEMLDAVGTDVDAGASVILMHDALGPGARRLGCAETARLVTSLRERGRRAGLEFVSISHAADQ